MRTNNTFNLHRFALLFRQNFIHSSRMLSISLVGFCGGVFILLLLVQFMNNVRTWDKDSFLIILLFVSIPLAIFYTGTAFPGFRSKEKSYNYILNPASAFEKFLFEFFNRIILFLLVVPLLYWIVFNVEGRFAELIFPEFTFNIQSMSDLPAIGANSEEKVFWTKVLILSAGSLIFTIPFTGATLFTKYPVLKTLFAVAVIFFFHLFLVYFFIEILHFKEYHLPRDSSILFIKNDTGVIRALAIYSMIFNAGLLVAAYFKLREKEV